MCILSNMPSKKYYWLHREKNLLENKEYYSRRDIKDKINSKKRENYNSSEEKRTYILERNRKRYELKKDNINEHRREKYANVSIEEKRKKNKEQYRNRAEIIKKQVADWRKTQQGHVLKKMQSHRRRINKKNHKNGFTKEEWKNKVIATNGICSVCKKNVGIEKMTMDHEPALSIASEGFVYKIENVFPMCVSCNSSKGSRVSFTEFYFKRKEELLSKRKVIFN